MPHPTRAQGVPVAPRRAHAVAALGDRHLLVTGGYDGGAQLLGDALVLDTQTGTWHAAPVHAGACVGALTQASAAQSSASALARLAVCGEQEAPSAG